MKKIITLILFLACCKSIDAQVFSYKVTPYDTLFSLDVVQVSDNGRDTVITRKGQLDTASVRSQIYSEIRQAYNRIARMEASIQATWRLRSAYLSALNEVGLNDYFVFERDRIAEQLNGRYVLSLSGSRFTCEVSNSDRRLVLDSEQEGIPVGTIAAVLVPRSRLYIALSIRPEFVIDDGTVDLFSSDGQVYRGEDSQGNRYVLRRQ